MNTKGDVILGTYHSLMAKYIAVNREIAKHDMEHYVETIGKCKSFYVKKYKDNLFGILGVPKDSEKNRHHRCVQGFRTMEELNEFAGKNGLELSETENFE